MPQLEAHLQASEANAYLARELITLQGGLAWSPVLAFYSALHQVDTYLALSNVHPTSHVARRSLLRETAGLLTIFDDYRLLETLSRDARYDLRTFTSREATDLIEGELARITATVAALIRAANP